MCKEVCPLFGFLFGVMGYEFGAIEAVGAVIFVGMSVDYFLHMAHGQGLKPGPTFGFSRLATLCCLNSVA